MQPETENAIAKYEQSRAAALALGDTRKAVQAGNDLGVSYYLQGRLAEAQTALEEAQAALAPLDEPLLEARAAGNLARVQDRLGNRKLALVLYRQAADLFHEGKDFETESLTLRMLSQTYFQMGDVFSALTVYTHALECKPHRNPFDTLLLALFRIPVGMMGRTS